jgi:hypothetical protein
MRVGRTFNQRRRRDVLWGVGCGVSLTLTVLTGYNVWQKFQVRREVSALMDIMRTVADECSVKGDDI